MKAIMAGVMISAVLTGPAHADLVSQFLAQPDGCHGVVYDEEHLAAHPRQQITGLSVSNSAKPDRVADAFVLDLALSTRDGQRHAFLAYCENDQCRFGEDQFLVTETGDGLVLHFAESPGLQSVMGAGEMTSSDDLVFIIYREPLEFCQGPA